MQIKDKQTSQVSNFKQGFADKFKAIKPSVSQKDMMQIALALDISFITVNRYMTGSVKELRSLELAERILSTAKEVIDQKPAPAAQ